MPPMSQDREPAEIAPAWTPDAPAFEAHVLRAFIRDGRLSSIPARDRKKLVVYRYLLDQVLPDPDELVPERTQKVCLAGSGIAEGQDILGSVQKGAVLESIEARFGFAR